jgi:hypothetical protein
MLKLKKKVDCLGSKQTLYIRYIPEAVDMNGRFQMQGGKNWILPK